MKTRILLSCLLLAALLSSLVLPAMAQGPAVDVIEPAPEKAPPEGKGLPEYPGLPHQAGLDGVGVDYAWSQTTGTYTEITGGTQLTTSCDDTSYNANTIPFTFTFNGTDYTQFSLSCNGFIAMGATVSSTYTPISSTSNSNVIAALGGDQQTNTTNSEIRYETLGTSPNQVLVIQWKNFRHYGATGDIYNYQIRLHETSNLVEVVYGAFTQNATARTSQVGIRGTTNADFNSRTSASDWINSSPSALNTDTMALTTAYVPPSGLTWDWSIIVGPNLSQSTKAAPGKVAFGEPIEYTIEILNTGLAPALEASLVDPIPAGTVYNGDVACSSGQCWYDSGAVYWAGQVATPPKADWQPQQNAGGRQAKGPDAAANPSGERTVAPKVNGTVLLDQQPNQLNGIFSDANCDLCGGAQVVADNFAVEDTASIEQIVMWGGFYSADVPGEPDSIRVVFHTDNGGLPGTAVYDESNVAYARAQTGVVLFGVHEWVHTLTLATPAALPAGNYWLEVFFSTGVGDYSDYFWEVGNPDTYGRGLFDTAFAFEAPGVNWYYPNGYEQALQLIGTIGAQEPENPVTVTFSVTPDPVCGAIVVNEAVIDDPEISAPVVVQTSTEVWEMVLLHEDFEGDVFPPAGWVEAHDAAGMAWTDQDLEPRGNLTGGTGKFAIVDDDYGGSAALTTAQLWTPPFDIPAGGYATQLLFKTDYNNISTAEQADVDISLDGGGTWTNVLHWNADHRGPLTQSVDLTPFAGATGAILRFYYYDGAAYAWWWEIDDVQVVACYAAAPEIDVTPAVLNQTLCPDETAEQTLTICNLGDAPLTWSLSEAPEGKATAGLTTHSSGGQKVLLKLDGVGGPSVETNPPVVNAPVSLVLDDGSRDNDIGLGGTIEMLWVNRFTPDPGLFPFDLTEVQVYFSSVGLVNIGDDMKLVFYENTTGNNDPAVGSNFLAVFDVTVQALDTWNVYTLPTPVTFAGPGDAVIGLIGMETPGTSYWPASIDQTATQARSWAGWWNSSPPPNPPVLPPPNWTLIDAYFPGNWMVRGYGETGAPPDIPWLSEDPLEGTVDPGTCQDVTVTFDSTGLTPGTYTGSLEIDSNDADEPTVTIPVALTVEACGENTMHIGNLTGNVAMDPYGRIVARWYVLTHDGQHAALPYVLVDASIWDPIGGPFVRSRITKPSGWARFHWGRDAAGTFQLCVDNLTLAGYTYQPADNDVPNCLSLP